MDDIIVPRCAAHDEAYEPSVRVRYDVVSYSLVCVSCVFESDDGEVEQRVPLSLSEYQQWCDKLGQPRQPVFAPFDVG